MYVDTHCHIHDLEFYPDSREEVYRQSRDAGVVMLVVGTDVRSSRAAVEFARNHPGCFALVGVHPHEAKDGEAEEIRELARAKSPVLVGVGEIGLDYFYFHSPREQQIEMLRAQLEVAVEYDLPVSFHVRDTSSGDGRSVWDDFWPVFDDFPGVRGVLHSFTDTAENARKAIDRGLYIGVNGISTFTRDKAQQELYAELPLEKILLETDAPFLTPAPLRGRMNTPAYVGRVAEHQAQLKQVPVTYVARMTTANARELFGKKLDARN